MSFMIPLFVALAPMAPIAIAQSSATPAAVPADWSTLRELRLLRRPAADPALSNFVRDESVAGRCKVATRSASGTILSIDLAVLVGPGGRVKQIVPRAIDCVAVEQYAAGLVSRSARDNIDAAGLTGDTWFRTTMTFAWAG